jgi:fermentation-respiration switch protein FrsA (DUF1100 family)
MARLFRFLIVPVIAFFALTVAITENGLHVPRRVPQAAYAEEVAGETQSVWAPARVTSADGLMLEGWLFTPQTPNGAAVLLLHGVADTRQGMLGHAQLFLQAGYTVLLPDFRGHGSSGGAVLTYGVKEADDVSRWCAWLLATQPVQRVYGLGRSMGAAILIESLPREPNIRAAVAECPFSSFRDVADYRLARASHIPGVLLWPMVDLGFSYARLRYGVNLYHASPADAIRSARVPLLLIHGAADTNIPPEHSARLHALNPATTLWLVPGARHLDAMSIDPAQYARKVLEWFREH